MSVQVKGQYYYQFSLASKKDFIQERDFVSFTMIEESGNTLPIFSLSFNTQDESILPLLNDGNEFKVTFGKDISTAISVPLAITSVNSDKVGQNKRNIVITGIYGTIAYMTQNRLAISTPQSGIEVISSVASKYFKVESNITKSLDSQKWIQYNVSDRAYINSIWLHSDLDTSFPAIGISSDGKFIIKDIKRDLSTPYKWRFGKNKTDESRDIAIDGDPHIKTQTGFMNAWTGFGREKIVYDLDTALDTATLSQQEPIMALTAKMAKNSEIEKRFASVGIQNDNTHPTYWKSYLKNLTALSSFLNVTVTLSFHNDLKPVRVLDQVMYKEDDISQIEVSSAYLSGIYYVTKVARTVENTQLVTVVQLGRESFNQIRTGL